MSQIRMLPRSAIWIAVGLLGLALLFAWGGWRVSQAEARLQKSLADNSQKHRLMEKMSEAMTSNARSLRTLVMLNEPVQITKELKRLAAIAASYEAAAAELEAMPASSAMRTAQNRLRDAYRALQALQRRVVELARGNRHAEAIQMLTREVGPASVTWREVMRDNLLLQKTAARQEAAIAEKIYDDTLMTIIPFAGVVLVVSLFIGLWPSRGWGRHLPRQPVEASGISSAGNDRQVRSLEELASIVRSNVETAQCCRTLATTEVTRKGGVVLEPELSTTFHCAMDGPVVEPRQLF